MASTKEKELQANLEAATRQVEWFQAKLKEANAVISQQHRGMVDSVAIEVFGAMMGASCTEILTDLDRGASLDAMGSHKAGLSVIAYDFAEAFVAERKRRFEEAEAQSAKEKEEAAMKQEEIVIREQRAQEDAARLKKAQAGEA